MSDTVLYRTYRPKNFAEVAGQSAVVEALSGAIKQGKIAHSYLFSGSRGTGKTSVARIFAREIGTSGNDVYEIDAASNRGIDDIREIRDGVSVLPFESKYKVYIVDEVHMLTKEAWNAFLKTLEEPPPHAVFILATTEADKVPETVTSRCQVFNFRTPSQEIIREQVVFVAKSEGFSLEPSAAELVALLADGSFRDALGILQKAISVVSGKKVKVEDVERVAGAPKRALVRDTVSGINSRDGKKPLAAIASAMRENVDMNLFLTLVLNSVRAVLLLRFNPALQSEFEKEYSPDDLEFLKNIASEPNSAINSKTVLELLKAAREMRSTPIASLPLELAIMNIVGQDDK